MTDDTLNTPAVRKAETKVAGLLEAAKSFNVATVEQYEAGADELKQIKAAQKNLEDLRTGMTGPLNASLKKINDFFRAPTERLREAEHLIKRALIGFTAEQEKKRREAQAKLDAEARKEREKIAAQAAKAAAAGKAERAEMLQRKSASVVAPIIAPPAPQAAGISERTVWHGECTDLMALVKAIAAGTAPLSLVLPNAKVISQQARSLRADFIAPGVRVWSDKSMAAGSI